MRRLVRFLRNHSLYTIGFFLGAALLLEVAAFNFRFFESLPYRPITDYQMELGSGMTGNEDGTFTCQDNGENTIRLTGFDTQLSNVYFNAELFDESAQALDLPLRFRISVNDASRSGLYDLPDMLMMHSVPGTYVTHLETAGNSDTVEIRLLNTGAYRIRICFLGFNMQRPFLFSAPRVILVFMTLMFLFLFWPASPLYKKSLTEIGVWRRLLVAMFAGGQTLLLVGLACSNPVFRESPWDHSLQYQELAEAMADGQLYLKEEPSEELMALGNPYDYSLRGEEGVEHRWDVAYYNGKYYVYFGVVPCVLLYLPWQLLTGSGFPNYVAVVLGLIFFSVGTFEMLWKIAKKIFPATSVGIYCLLGLVFVNGSGACFIAHRPDMYSIPIIWGLAFTVWGLYFWLSAIPSWNGRGEPCLRNKRLAAGSFCMALVAGCRPQLLLASFFAIPILAPCIIRKGQDTRQRLKECVCFLLPYLIIAVGLMAYNNLRFGSVFDFGANYNLTTNDMTKRGWVWGRLPQGFFTYLFRLPSLVLNPPFLEGLQVNTLYPGQTIAELTYGGLLVSNPVLWLLAAKEICKGERKKNVINGMFWLSILFGVIIIAADTEMAGILQRYVADFAFFFFFAAALVVLSLEGLFKGKEGEDYFRKIFLVLCILTLLYNILMIFVMDNENLSVENPHLYYTLTGLLQFWR